MKITRQTARLADPRPMQALAQRPDVPLGELLDAYLAHSGPILDPMEALRRRIKADAAALTGLPPYICVDDIGRVDDRVLEAAWQPHGGLRNLVPDMSGVERIAHLPAEPNPHAALVAELPAHVLRAGLKPERPALELLVAHDVYVYATQLGCCVLRRDGSFLPDLSSAHYAMPLDLEAAEQRRAGIVVQDIYGGSNICHWTCDHLPRLLRLLSMGHNSAVSALCSGYLSPFQRHSLGAFAATEVEFHFPATGELLHFETLYGWSDLGWRVAHPAQYGHAVTIGLIQDMLRRMPAPLRDAVGQGPRRRLYVTRADAAIRRVAEEEAVLACLAPRGFESVALSHLSPGAQTALFADAEAIVAPHGAGLTHILAMPEGGALLELHAPARGTDAYAVLARATGQRYRCLLGEGTVNEQFDFTVNLAELADALDVLGL